jgi:hypothetical protein
VLWEIASLSATLIKPEKHIAYARIEPDSELFEKSIVSDALVASLSALLKISLSYGCPLPDDVMKMINHIDNPDRLFDLVAIYFTLTQDEQQEIPERNRNDLDDIPADPPGAELYFRQRD